MAVQVQMENAEAHYPASLTNQNNQVDEPRYVSETRWIPATGRSDKPNNCWYSLRFFQRQIIVGISLLVALVLFAIFMYILYA